MIPVKLEIEGLYSYKEKQTIDFTQLTGAGLFGIFGAVGSGKSSILEAILLALYGTTERLASKGEKNSMVNLQSSGISIHFEFKAGKNNAQTFKASYLAKRNSKNFDDVKPATHTFYEMTSDGWLPLEAKGEALIGMKMDHFRQTVIIPQGKFREFIEQKPKDRADMMKELFGLERFDLAGNTKRLLSAEKEKKIKLETQLEGLAEFTKTFLQEAEEKLQGVLLRKETETKLFIQQEKALNGLTAIKEKAEQLAQLKVQMDESDRLLPLFQQKRSLLSQYQKALTYVKPLLDQFHELEIDLEKYQVSVKDCERFKDRYAQEVLEKRARYQKLYQDYSSKGEKEARIRDLLQIKELNQLTFQKNTAQKKLKELEQQNQLHQDKKNSFTHKIEQAEAEISALKVPEMSEISQLERTYATLHQLDERQKNHKMQLANLDKEVRLIQQAQEKLLKKTGLETPDFSTIRQTISEQLQSAQKERERLLQQQGLFAYSNHLHTGKPCPLCGALEHPTPLSPDFDQGILEQNLSNIQELNQQGELLRNTQSEYEKLQLTLENYLKNQAEKKSESEEDEQQYHKLLRNAHIQGDIDALSTHLQAAKATLQQEKSLQQQLKSFIAEQRTFLAKAEQDLLLYQEAEQQVKTFQIKIETKLHEVNYPDLLEKYREATPSTIDEDIAKVKRYLEDLEVNLPRAQDALNETLKQQTTNLANLETFQGRLIEVKSKMEKLDEALSHVLAQHQFTHAAAVKDLLAKEVDTIKLEEEIRTFDRARDIAQAKIQELKANADVAGFDQAAFDSAQASFQTAKLSLEQTQNELALLQKHIEDIQHNLKEKMRLEKEYHEVEKRETNLRELDRLFQGSGFVKFVSNIYLKELVQTANIRFMQLAKNSLSLEVDENNTFWVQDHLNGGKKRLLKTLSGGQTFQASLCLALALAEKVKSLNRADQSFFFLDEGFGALDKNALRTVFETLKSLRHEKRIVGIISHVEELQQEIGVYAQVELDPERGSQVSYSF